MSTLHETTPGYLAYQRALSPIRRQTLEALGAAVGPTPRQTSVHRWTGEDTLSWGPPAEWIRVSLVQCALEELPAILDPCLREFAALQETLEGILLRQWESLYQARGELGVRAFVSAHPELSQILVEAHPYLRRRFGSAVQVVLQVLADPEAPGDGHQQLVAFIQTELPVEEALAQLDGFDEEWLLAQLDRVGAHLSFNLEFL